MPESKRVTVFGGGEATGEVMEKAEAMGRMLAESGVEVVSGGYGGVMEAISKGAASVAGGKAIGITLSVKPKGNQYLTQTIVAEAENAYKSFGIRLGMLLESRGYLFFDGGIGTLTEVSAVFNLVTKLQAEKPILFMTTTGVNWHESLDRHFPDVEKRPSYGIISISQNLGGWIGW